MGHLNPISLLSHELQYDDLELVKPQSEVLKSCLLQRIKLLIVFTPLHRT